MKTILSIYQSKSVKPVKSYSKSDVVTKHKSHLTTQASDHSNPLAIDVTKLESNFDLDKYTPYLD